MLKAGSTKSIHVVFFTPYYRQNRGNATTAKRIVYGLQQRGMKVTVFAYEEGEWSAEMLQKVEQASIFHILHLKRFAEWHKRHPFPLNKPYVLTSGGTDINEDLKNEAAAKLMKFVADESCAITVFSEDGKQKIIGKYKELTERIHIIPQSIWLPEGQSKAPLTLKGYPRVLLPAGLRPVKDVFFVLEALNKLRKRWPSLMFYLIGAPLDEKVTEQVQNVSKVYPWVQYLGEVSLREMSEVYRAVDLVINTSISEGQSTALLEAMLVGKPVLARRIPGNESIIQEHVNGLLFSSPDEFSKKLTDLLESKELFNRLALQGKKYVQIKHRMKDEIDAYHRVYEHCIEKATVHN
ncbi:glycosyltransferase [Halalkalibacterium ligniniphilum]|uniref:glycosyltransferase n=1 Tax=Halalkalibacterium ligniniphilum TaxID=1134413 RepID=UPI00034D12ED|nr:glycosyltransferase [Halalkalibacterium ligniniphilum]